MIIFLTNIKNILLVAYFNLYNISGIYDMKVINKLKQNNIFFVSLIYQRYSQILTILAKL